MKLITVKRYLPKLLIILGAVALGACGSGNSEQGATNGQPDSGSVGVLLTDMPAEPGTFLAVNVTIESIDLLGNEEAGKVNVFSGPSQTVNLLDLKNESMPFTFQDGVPAGEYCKIRLTLSELELVLADDTPDDSTDNETAYPSIPGNNKLDLVVRDCFSVRGGETLVLQLDMDAGRSIHVVGNSQSYRFRPVVFVDVLDEAFEPKLLRLTGEVKKYDAEAASLLLCQAVPTNSEYFNGCAEVRLDSELSAYFDNVEYAGAPRGLDELFNDANLGVEMTIVGWPNYAMPMPAQIDIPDGHLPEPGECRLWDTALEPGQQQAPVECDALPDTVDAELVVINHDGYVVDPDRPLIIVDALVVEEGDFLQLEGIANQDADMNGVRIAVADGASVVSDDLAVTFQAGEAGVNGTRFVSKSGTLLNETAVQDGIALQLDGVLEVISESDSSLKTALVIVDLQSLVNDLLEGEVSEVNEDSVVVSLGNEIVCGVMLSQYSIDLNAEFDLLTVTITEDASEISAGGTFEVGQSVGLNGSCDGSDYVLDSAVIVDDQRE